MRKIVFERPTSEVFVTSDNHFFHRFITGFRGFNTVEEHNEAMIANWNAAVSPTDMVISFGDFSFGNRADTAAVVERLNGEKWVIPGNHDDSKRLEFWFGADRVLPQLVTIKVINPRDAMNDFMTFEASHYPLASWNGSDHGRLHLHGHLHTVNGHKSHHFCAPYQGAGTRFDIGIDNAIWFGVPYSPIRLPIVAARYMQDQLDKANARKDRAEMEDNYV